MADLDIIIIGSGPAGLSAAITAKVRSLIVVSPFLYITLYTIRAVFSRANLPKSLFYSPVYGKLILERKGIRLL